MSNPTQKLAFKGGRSAVQNSVVPRVYSLAEILRTAPTLVHAAAILQGDGVDCRVGKGFANIMFFSVSGITGAQELAKAEYVVQALNSARPKNMFEQIASMRGTSISIDIEQLRKAMRHAEASYVLGDTQTHMAHIIQSLSAIITMIETRRSKDAPLYEGFTDEPVSRSRRAHADATV